MLSLCAVRWPLLFHLLLQTKTLRTMTRWMVAAPLPPQREPHSAAGSQWAWAPFDGPPAPRLRVRMGKKAFNISHYWPSVISQRDPIPLRGWWPHPSLWHYHGLVPFSNHVSSQSLVSAGKLQTGSAFLKTMFTSTSLSHFSLMCSGRDGSSAGAVDEEDFIQAFEDVPTVQVGRVPWAHLAELNCVGRVDQIM